MRKSSRFHELSGDVVPEDTLQRLRNQMAAYQANVGTRAANLLRRCPSKVCSKGCSSRERGGTQICAPELDAALFLKLHHQKTTLVTNGRDYQHVGEG